MVTPVRTPVGWRLLDTRPLDVPRADALGWDIPIGYGADPPELTGRAALAARYVARALARPDSSGVAGRDSSGVAGWMRRHSLREHESCFSFWSPTAATTAAGELASAIAGIDRAPGRATLRAMADAQLIQSRSQQATPHVVLFRAMDAAAWGRSASGGVGDADTLATVVDDGGFGAYLQRCLDDGGLVVPGSAAGPRSVPGLTWRGDLVNIERSGLQCRVAVQHVLDPRLSDPATLAVLAEYLDGPDGLVQRRLRAEAGIVYGGAAVPREDGGVCSMVVGVSMLVENLPAVLVGMRELLAEIDTGELEPDRLADAARRTRFSMIGRLDGPFGSLEEHRRVSAGLVPLRDSVDDIERALRRVDHRPRLSRAHRPAVCFVGILDDADRDQLEATLW